MLNPGLTIHWEGLQQMQLDVTARAPEEACGLLGGVGRQVIMVYPVSNILHSPTRFLMDPLEQVRALHRIEAENMDLLAIYHSHPNGPAFPSITDLDEFAYPGVDTIIWSPGASPQAGWQARAFQLDGGIAREVLLEVLPPG